MVLVFIVTTTLVLPVILYWNKYTSLQNNNLYLVENINLEMLLAASTFHKLQGIFKEHCFPPLIWEFFRKLLCNAG